jgi:hypothetical protein
MNSPDEDNVSSSPQEIQVESTTISSPLLPPPTIMTVASTIVAISATIEQLAEQQQQ